jgi:hypothetical protein
MGKALKKKRLQHILLGFLLASSTYLYMEYRYEQKTLQAFIGSIYSDKKLNRYDDEAVILAAMDKTHLQMKQNEISAMDLKISNFERFFTSPLMAFALTKDGACGGNSLILAQILDGMGYNVRTSQMMVNGLYGGHIIVETKLNNKWIALDPMYNLSFRNNNGALASVGEIKDNWMAYQSQLPPTYKKEYKYDGFRYTNWNRVPVLGAIAKSTLTLFMGKKGVDKFSFRKLLFNPKKILFFFTLYLLGFSFLSILNNRYLKIHLPRVSFKPKVILKPTAA